MLKIAPYFLIMFFTLGVAGQNLIKCDDGSAYWILKGKGKTFAAHLRGDLAESEIPKLMNVEETALHYNILNKSDYAEKGKSSSDAAILTRFIKGEEKFLGEKMKPVYEIRKLSSGKSFLLWHHDWHGSDEYVEQQVHATIILDETIVWLSSPLFTGQDLDKIEAFMAETIANVKLVKSTKGLCGK